MEREVSLYKKNIRYYLLAALIALELLMSFSFLGYVHIEPISITFAYIPVLLAGVLGGLPEAVILGAVFGLSSMWKAGANYVLPFDQLFSPFLSGHPLESLALSVGSRTLFGFFIGLLYMAAKRVRGTGFWIFLISIFGRFFHSVLVYSTMGLLFPETGYHIGNALQGFGTINNIVTSVMTAVIVTLLWRLEKLSAWQDFCLRVEKAQRLQLGGHYHRFSFIVITLLTICLSMAVAVYFVNRMNYVLSQSGIILSKANYSDLMHLQLQFLIGILSMMVLVVVFLILNRKYTAYTDYEAKIDALTGVMTRNAFFHACGKAMRELCFDKNIYGYFVMIDVDHFKNINDHYGHPEGDRILRNIAQELREIFSTDGLTGRVGGDEFAILIYMPMPKETLETKLEFFLEQVHKIEIDSQGLSCSIGAVCVTEDKTIEAYYLGADRLLYMAKKQGRDRYVIGTLEDTAS